MAGANILNEVICLYILGGGLLRGDESDLEELGNEREAVGVTGCTSTSVEIGIVEESEREDGTIHIRRAICRCPSGASHLVVDTAGVDGLLHLAVLNDGEAINSKEMGIGEAADSTS